MLDRDSKFVEIHDRLDFKRPSSKIKWYLTLAYEPVAIGSGTLLLSNGQTGIIMEFDGDAYSISIEEKDISGDKKLSESWGDSIYRICLETKNKSVSHDIYVKFTTAMECDHE